MRYIVKPRISGKTTYLIKKTIKNDGYLIVHSHVDIARIVTDFPELQGRVFAWKDLPQALFGKKERKLFIDNADMLLKNMFSEFEIDTITLNSENNPKYKGYNVRKRL
jgi:hypothetical protein